MMVVKTCPDHDQVWLRTCFKLSNSGYSEGCKVKVMEDTLNTVHEITKLIKKVS